MSEEIVDQQAPVTPPAVAQTTEPTEHMIPKSRFDEVNAKLKELQSTLDAQQRQKEQTEREAAEKQGEFKTLYEEVLQKFEAERSRAAAAEDRALRQRIAAKHKLPDGFDRRLQGTTEEELEADAKELVKTLPKPLAPNTNPSQTKAPSGNTITEEDANEFAAIYGFAPSIVKKQLGLQG